VSHIEKFKYAYSNGQLIQSTDQNNQSTSYLYNDLLRRLTETDFPDGGKTTISYNDAPSLPSVTTSRLINTSSQYVTRVGTMDGIGHVVKTLLTTDPDCASGDKTDTTYDLGRVLTETLQDGSIQTYSYSGNCTTATDPAGIARKSCSDGLGRLAQVFEAPAGLNYETDYTYDALDNLLSVVQAGSRQRTFTYDSLSRLLSATNPESGTIGYSYDPNGNLSSKVAPAPNQTGSATVTTTYSYDALNRLTLKSYSDGTTPYAQYTYDANPPGGPIPNVNNIGRLAYSWSPNYTGNKYNYDPMGRVANSLECIDVSCNWNFDSSYTYDLLGNLTAYTNKIAQWTNPPVSSITFNQQFDSAGRVSQLTSSWVDAQHPATLATVDSSVGYWPTGALRKVALGNGLYETAAYNNRLQPCRMNVNSSATYFSSCTDSAPAGNSLDFSYGFNTGTNNGNVASWSAAGQQTFNRIYAYDSLNRLNSMSSPSDPSGCTGLSWTVDPWGNRTDQTVTGGTCNTFHASVNTQNQLVDPVNYVYQYDAAGNMTYDGSHTYTYDAENHLTAVDGGATASYAYDPSGRRVSKTIGATNTSYAHDLVGNVVFETQGSTWETVYLYFAGGLKAQYKNGLTSFIHKDHLGSTRLVTAVDQSIVDNLDYLPFGEQVLGDTATTHKFTGKERDSESGLDNSVFRYYGSSLGRFMSPDPSGMDLANPLDPQQLNLYAYARNNPLTFTDPYGLDCAYLNNAGNGIESVDSHSSAGECTGTGGYWVSGQVNQVSVSDNGSYQFGYSGQKADGTLISQTYDTYLAPKPAGSPNIPPQCGYDLRCDSQGHVLGMLPNIESDNGTNFLVGGLFGAGLKLGAGLLGGLFDAGAEDATTIIFGHGARHLAGTGLQQAAVENAIRTEIQQTVARSAATGEFWGKVTVDGQQVFYRAFTLPNGTINVGTYTVGAP
jgi:RHS repeat-associated protein